MVFTMAGKSITIAILSYHLAQHPRAIKIVKTIAKHGYKVKLWSARRIKKRIKILSSFLEYLVAIVDVMFLKADVYWVENIPDIVYLPLVLFRKKYVYDRRSPWALEAAMMYRLPKPLIKIMSIIEILMAKKSSYFVAVSKALAKEFEKIVKKSIVIPNYPEKSFVKNISPDVIRKELNVPINRKVFVFIGKLSRVEGVDLLIKVVENIKDLDAELWIIGDGPERKVVKELCSMYPKTVKWFGWIPHNEIPKYIAASDIGLAPRHKTQFNIYYSYEGIHKIAEYFAYGKPVIASGISPSPYYVVVDPSKLGEAVAKTVKGELKLPKPPKLFWENYSENLVLKVIEEVVKPET